MELSTYFDHEDEATQLHEYLNGSVYALPSRESAQELLLKNISAQIEQQKLKDVHVLPLDMRVQTPEPTYIYYPGLCLSHRPPKMDQAVTREPVVVIELVTPTTERSILHEKSLHYQRIPSVKEIIYIWPTLKIAHVDFRDGESSKWSRKFYGIEDKIPLTSSVGEGELVLADIFNDMVSSRSSLRFQRIDVIDSLIGSDKKEEKSCRTIPPCTVYLYQSRGEKQIREGSFLSTDDGLLLGNRNGSCWVKRTGSLTNFVRDANLFENRISANKSIESFIAC